jgi:hypothetical protein
MTIVIILVPVSAECREDLAFIIEPAEMLSCGSSTLTRKLQQSILVDALAELGCQLDFPDSLEALDMGEDITQTWYA